MAYSAKIWAKVKADYESGNYSTIELREKFGITDRQIENKIASEKWEKGKNIPKIQQSIAEKNIALFAKLGMTDEDTVKRLVKGVKNDDDNVSLRFIQEKNKMCGSLAPVKKETDLTSGGEKLELPQIYLPDNGH